MKKTTKRLIEANILPCPLYQKEFSGYCEGCNQRLDCIVLAILRKVEYIEAKIDRLSSERGQ